ncbi:GntR family transcriptional regulator [Novosphingobium terrae]|uniref:GntR family transcriptional regulator n=1 Tax=Novosphingobium terrae TaxID=2726189 RepID=UPI0019812E5F|nr:GntR family transcriptional regulator [Novosphingobium terrae]
MSAGTTTDRVLAALRQLLRGEDMRPGDRLDPALLAERLSASATPVREALHLLTGEGMVEARSSGGFNLPFLEERSLQHRYDWSAQLLTLAVRYWPRHPREIDGIQLAYHGVDIATRTGDLFARIGRRSTNPEHGRAIVQLNAKLHRVRLAESHVIEDGDKELVDLLARIADLDHGAIQRNIAQYHRRRRHAVANILVALYQVP